MITTQSKPREQQRASQDFEQRLLDVARVARVTAGGRRFSFRAVVAVGDRSGRVGVGVKKGRDVSSAIDKASRSAKNKLSKVEITRQGSIPHEVYGKSSGAVVFLKPASEGRGIIAGGAVRAVCDLAGYKSITGKMISRTNNKLSNARATIEALNKIKTVGREGGKIFEPQIKEKKRKIKKDKEKPKKVVKKAEE